MSPWNSPVVLRRAWCLWEIFCSINAGEKVNFQICLPTSERTALKKGISENFNSILDALIAMDAQNAQAVNPKDRDMIFAVIKKECGFDVLNNMVKDQLRKWYVETGADIADVIIQEGGGESESKEFLKFLYNLGNALDDFGNYDRAIYFLEVGLKIELSVNGEKYTGAYLNALGIAYNSKGEYDLAIDYYECALKIKVASLGEDHPDVASSYNNLGLAYGNKGNYDKAINYYERALKITVASLGENHPSVASSYNNLGVAHKNKGEFDKAIDYYERALKIRVASLGEDHPSVASSYNNLGNTYITVGKFDIAIEFLEKALTIKMDTFGEDHPETKKVRNNIVRAKKAKAESSNTQGCKCVIS